MDQGKYKAAMYLAIWQGNLIGVAFGGWLGADGSLGGQGVADDVDNAAPPPPPPPPPSPSPPPPTPPPTPPHTPGLKSGSRCAKMPVPFCAAMTLSPCPCGPLLLPNGSKKLIQTSGSFGSMVINVSGRKTTLPCGRRTIRLCGASDENGLSGPAGGMASCPASRSTGSCNATSP